MKLIIVIPVLFILSTADGRPLLGEVVDLFAEQYCSVTAEVGETVILPVKVDLAQDSKLLNPVIKWKTETGATVHQYVLNHDYNEDQIKHFKNRTSLFKEEIIKGNVSLKITEVNKNDEGKYTCEVLHEDPEIKKTYKVFLCVTEKGEVLPESPKPEPYSSWVPDPLTVLLYLFAFFVAYVVLMILFKVLECLYDAISCVFYVIASCIEAVCGGS